MQSEFRKLWNYPEKIETLNEYLAVMRKTRVNPSPFEAEMSSDLLELCDTTLEPLCLKTLKLKGSAFKIHSAYKQYNESAQNFKIF